MRAPLPSLYLFSGRGPDGGSQNPERSPGRIMEGENGRISLRRLYWMLWYKTYPVSRNLLRGEMWCVP
ncbi:hypothetical protein DRO38_04850 [Candidatus Bathyarchaeota archaeon]|nr:MAG: hypothetical protein DRO38_04850 [Candidatus Bathyarchaeota archaeon]